MQLKEIRNLLVLFLKQFNKDDVSLLLNYLPIFLEDIQRDPLLLEKLSSSTAICFNTAINKADTEFVSNYEPAKEDANDCTDHWVAELNSKTNETSYDDDLHSEETNHSHFTDTNQLIPSRYSDSVVDYLFKQYTLNKYPKSDQLYQMSLETNLTAKQIQTWFSNTRFKLKHSKSHLASKSNSPGEQQSPDGSNEFNKNDQNELEVPEETSELLNMGSNILDNNLNDNTTVSNTTEIYEHEIENDEFIDQSILNRTRLPGEALDYLVTKYKKNKYPNSEEIYQMSLEIKLTTKKIKNWFDSTRFKLKHAKKSLKIKLKKVNFIIENYVDSVKEQIEADNNNNKDH